MWLQQFDKTVSKLVELLQSAPCPPEEWGFPVRGDALAEAAARMGAPIPEEGEYRMSAAGTRLEDLVDPIGWTLIHSLRHLQRQQHFDATLGQPLKKPKDGLAHRAYFVQQFQEHRPDVSARDVSVVTTILFQIDTDERKVREHRRRMDS